MDTFPAAEDTERDALAASLREVRAASVAACEPLQLEDYGLQAAIFASPPKWHLAHTSWFFETFILCPFAPAYRVFDPAFEELFNSYYNGIGEPFPRDRRGLLSRPALERVLAYRDHVERALLALLAEPDCDPAVLVRCRLGIEHERQHQELFYTDIKYSLSVNPLAPAFAPAPGEAAGTAPALSWQRFEGGLGELGHGGEGFAFDNEQPRHRVWLEPFQLASRLVTNAEYEAFIEDGGYRRPELWLADGWDVVSRDGWKAPLYWRDDEVFTLHGRRPRDPAAPVCHVSGYEADAYARWADARLPTEAEWERAAVTRAPVPSGIEAGRLEPGPSTASDPAQFYGACWQWTSSAYGPYPGFTPGPGAIGEYNGKFMSNQWVLRGGACVSPTAQLRPGYRNFFYPRDRWQFSGIRLARDCG
jgi:ergothioneine biosynthesis protein EgtB